MAWSCCSRAVAEHVILCVRAQGCFNVFLIFRNQCTPLLLAATSGALDTIQYLFSLGANWRKTDTKGNNIIHLSVLTFHTEVLKYIIELNIPELPVWKTLVGEYRAYGFVMNQYSDCSVVWPIIDMLKWSKSNTHILKSKAHAIKDYELKPTVVQLIWETMSLCAEDVWFLI